MEGHSKHYGTPWHRNSTPGCAIFGDQLKEGQAGLEEIRHA